MRTLVTRKELLDLKEWMQQTFVTRQEFQNFREEMLGFKQEMLEFKEQTITRFDKVFGFLEKLDQERIFLHQAILRIEEQLSRLGKAS